MSNINQPSFVFNSTDPTLESPQDASIVSSAQTLFGTGTTQGVTQGYLTNNYYNIQQINAITLSGSGINLNNYYTSGQTNTLFQPKGNYITGITSSNVTTALGYIPAISGATGVSYFSGLTGVPNTLTGYGISSGDTLFNNVYLNINSGVSISTTNLNNYYTSSVSDSRYLSATASTVSLNSPAFSGTPTAPTAPVTANTGQLATTQFVQNILTANTLYFSTGFTGSGTSNSPISVNIIASLGYTPASASTTLSGYNVSSGDTLFNGRFYPLTGNPSNFITTSSASSTYIPYSGATSNLNIGTNTFNAANIVGSLNSSSVASKFGNGQTLLQLIGNTGQTAVVEVDAFAQHGLIEVWRANGTPGIPTALILNDEIMAIGAGGYFGTGYTAEATSAIQFLATENWNNTSNGTRMLLNITPNGTTNLTGAVQVNQDLSLGVSGWLGTGQLSTNNLLSYASYDRGITVLAQANASSRAILELYSSGNTSATNAAIDFGTLSNTSQSNYRIATIFSTPTGSTSGNQGGSLTFSTKSDGGLLTSRMTIDLNGNVAFAGGLRTGANITGATATWVGSTPSALIGAAFNNGSAIYTDGSTITGTTLTNAAINVIQQGTLAAISTGVTYSSAASLLINAAPIAGTNVTISNPFAIQVLGGLSTFLGGISTNNNSTSSNFYAYGAGALGLINNAATSLLFGGASAISSRAIFNGQTSTALTAGNSYGGVIVGSQPITAAASGTHNLLANMVVNSLGIITTGSSTITNTASLYVGSQISGGTNNYALWSSGLTRVDGNLQLSNKIIITTGATNSSTGVATLVSGTVTVNTTSVTNNSLIFLTYNTPIGTLGELTYSTITAGVSFVINSLTTALATNTSDLSRINWWIIN